MVRVGLTLRPMTVADVPAVSVLERATYSTPWSEQVFHDELAQANRRYLLVEDGNGVAGYAGLILIADEAHVTTIAVDESRRGMKIGTRLMLELVEGAVAGGVSHLTLEVRVSNVIAQDLYRRFGMAPVGVRKNYYQNEDALIMWAHDIGSPEYTERLASIREGIDG